MDMVKGHKNSIPVITQVIDDFSGLDEILRKCYRYLQHRSMKIRFTKFCIKIFNLVSDKEPSEDSDVSK